MAEWSWKFSAPGALEATLAAWDGGALAAHNGAAQNATAQNTAAQNAGGGIETAMLEPCPDES